MPGTHFAPFPEPAWAWPTGRRDLLLRAACLPSDEEAVDAFRQWLDGRDFDDTNYAEQRLLVAIVQRLPAELDLPERPRLVGIERLLWTKSRFSLQGAAPALDLLATLDIPVMVIKGAARSVADMRHLRGRVANDVDLLVPLDKLYPAVKALLDDGWDGGLNRYDRLHRRAGTNLGRGPTAGVDVHCYPYHQILRSDAVDKGIWERAGKAKLMGRKVMVPSPTDQLAIAIGHGGIDGHGHSDWMVDCVALIREGGIDWNLFERLCTMRGIAPHAAIALGYIAERLQAPVDAKTLENLKAVSRKPGSGLWSALVLGHPKRQLSSFANLVRGVIRLHQMYTSFREVNAIEADRRIGPLLDEQRRHLPSDRKPENHAARNKEDVKRQPQSVEPE